MSTQLHAATLPEEIIRPADPDFSCVIVKAKWNGHITGALAGGALDYFKKAGIDSNNIRLIEVPGAVELVYGARRAIKSLRPSAVIVLGCVIRGDTPHFDYVCDSVTQGTAAINSLGDTPVIFGLLTVENETQALERAGGILGNKGYEAAQTAVEMANLANQLPID